MTVRPGGQVSTLPLHFIWIADCSGSMRVDGKIQELNFAIREAIPEMRRVADDNPHADVLVQAVRFASGASWHLATPTSITDFRWTDLHADGLSDLGAALRLVAARLTTPPMPERALPPVLALISDGQPTDDFEPALRDLLALPWGAASVRVAIAIGEDADHEILQRFIGRGDSRPLRANNPETLVNHIRFVSTAVLASVSQPAIRDSGSGTIPAIPIPALTRDSDDDQPAEDVW